MSNRDELKEKLKEKAGEKLQEKLGDVRIGCPHGPRTEFRGDRRTNLLERFLYSLILEND